MPRYSANALKAFARDVMQRLGADDEEAAILADGLTEGQLRMLPYSNQGFVRLVVYARRLRAGGLVPRARMELLVDGPATAVLDAGNGFGQVAGVRAMRLAVEKARAVGVGVVAVRNSNHYGMSGYFAMMAASAGCVGIAVTNASPEIPVAGGAEPTVGTNPWAIAAPGDNEEPFVLDVSNSQAGGRGAFRYFAERGEQLPPGWALDIDGRPTQDPADALKGMVAPMGGYKGVAITVMMDVLAGVLSGARFGATVGSPYQLEAAQGVGHLMIAIDIARFLPLQEFGSGIDRLARELRAGRKAPGVDRLLVPGEPELERRRGFLRAGCELRPEVEDGLRVLAVETNVPFPEPVPSVS